MHCQLVLNLYFSIAVLLFLPTTTMASITLHKVCMTWAANNNANYSPLLLSTTLSTLVLFGGDACNMPRAPAQYCGPVSIHHLLLPLILKKLPVVRRVGPS